MKKRILSMLLAAFMVLAIVPLSAITAFAATETELNYPGIYINVPAMIGGEKVSVSDITIKQYNEDGIQINDAYQYVEVYAVDDSGEALWKKEDRFGEVMGDSELYQADVDYYVTFGIQIKDEYRDTHKFAQAFVDARNIFIQSGENLAELSFNGDYDHIKMTVKIIPEIPKIHLAVSQLVDNGTMTVGDIEITDKLNGAYYTFTNNDKWLKNKNLSVSTSEFVPLTEKLSADSSYGTIISLQETVGYIGDNTEIIIDCPSYYYIEHAGDGFVAGKHTTHIHLYCYPQEVINEIEFEFDTYVGQKISDVDFNIDSNAKFFPYANSPSWYRVINGSNDEITDPNYTIKENEEYFVVFIVYPKDGYRFDQNATVVWSGEQQKTVVVQAHAYDYFNVGFKFTHVVEPIRDLDIQVTPPIAGEIPATTIVEKDGKVTANRVIFDGTFDNGKFIEGEQYELAIQITPTTDYKFPLLNEENVSDYESKFLINGESVDEITGYYVNAQSTTLWLLKTFTCVSAHTHTYTNSVLQKDDTSHWLECDATDCPDKLGSIKDKVEHTFSTDFKTDAENHWKECACGAKTENGAHSGGTATCTAKAKCEICNADYGSVATHTHGTEFKNDADNHWNECECGDKANVAAHADTNNDEKCDVCSYAMPKAPSDNETEKPTEKPTDATDKPTDATDSKKDDETEAPADKGCGGCGSSAALSALAIVAVVGSALVIKKKED